MNSTTFYCMAIMSGMSAYAGLKANERPHLFRPMLFQNRIGSVVWDVFAVVGGICSLVLFVYGFVKFGVSVSFIAFCFFVFGTALTFPIMRYFGPLALLCNIILTFNAMSLAVR